MLALAATNSSQNSLCWQALSWPIPKIGFKTDGGGGTTNFLFNNDADFLYETASNFQISQSQNVP